MASSRRRTRSIRSCERSCLGPGYELSTSKKQNVVTTSLPEQSGPLCCVCSPYAHRAPSCVPRVHRHAFEHRLVGEDVAQFEIGVSAEVLRFDCGDGGRTVECPRCLDE